MDGTLRRASGHSPHAPGTDPASGRGTLRGALLFWGAVALVMLWCFPYHRWLQHANELPRIFLTMAVVEEGRLGIDTYQQRFGYRKAMDISRAVCLAPRLVRSLRVRIKGADGRVQVFTPRYGHPRGPPCQERHYSNKAPGQSLLAVPAYVALRALWRGSDGPANVREVKDPDARAARLRQAVRWARLTTASLPAFLFLLLLAWWLRPWVPDPHVRRVAVAAYGLGTLALTYSVQLMSHQLATVLLFTGFILVNAVVHHRLGRTGARAWAWLGLAGLAAGAALACDYQLVFAAAALAVYGALAVRPLPRILGVALGAAPPLGLLLYYHYAAFGSALWTGYEFLVARDDQALHARGLLGMTRPTGEAFWGSFFRPDNGLFYFSPWLLVALGGLGALWRFAPRASQPAAAPGGGGLRGWLPSPEATFHVLVIFAYGYFISSITFWRGGWQTGPRYIAAMLPCFVLPYALLLQRLRPRPVAWAAAVAPALFAIGVYALVITGFPHFPEKFKYPLFDLVGPLLEDGYVSYTLGGWLFGHSRAASLLPYGVALLCLGGYLATGPVHLRGAATASAAAAGRNLVAGILAVMLATWIAAGYARLAHQGMRQAWSRPVVGTRGERYGAFLRRAHRDIRRHWEPRLLGATPPAGSGRGVPRARRPRHPRR